VRNKRRILKKRIMKAFPALRSCNFRITSRPGFYNCIAWAASVNNDWWEYRKGYTWPNATRSPSVDAAVEVYKGLGYEDCDMNAALEPGWEKVAVYGDQYGYTHAARQLESGNWTSKLGKSHDIEHKSLDDLLGTLYGKVKCIMKRKRSAQPINVQPSA
jgi:hypothetical protein